MSARRLKVIHAGGTLGMLPGSQGLETAPGFPDRLLTALTPSWLKQQQLELHFQELNPLLDSSAMQASHWFQLAAACLQAEATYDGVVLLQGTDTLAWTASALYWLLPQLKCPVLVTAAQKPLGETGSDALANVKQALLWASQPELQGVYVNFHHQLFDPRFCRKFSSLDLDAFRNPQGPPLAFFQRPLQLPALVNKPRPAWHANWLLTSENLQQLATTFTPRILRLPLIPGLEDAWLSQLPQHFDALLLEGTGTGTSAPLPAFYKALELSDCLAGMLSQCWTGGVQATYAASAPAFQAGVINLGKTTPENAQTSLTWLLALEFLGLIKTAERRQLWKNAILEP